MKKYLIIGSSGLIGSNLTKRLIENSFVYGLSRKPHFNHPHFKWIPFDLESSLKTEGLPKDLDAILYLAQSEYFRDFPQKTQEVFNVNVSRYLEVLNFAVRSRIDHVVYASSGGVYEQSPNSLLEKDRLSFSGELGFYLGSKICGEVLSTSFQSLLNVQILRFFFVYGPGQRETMLIPRLIHNIKSGNPIDLEGNNGIIMNPIHVNDAVSGIQKVLENKNSEIYNIGGKEILSLRQICEAISQFLGKEPQFRIKEGFKKLCGDITKIQELGWNPEITFEKGLQTFL